MTSPSALICLLLALVVAGCAQADSEATSSAPPTSSEPTVSEETQRPGESSVRETLQVDGETRTVFDLSGCLNPRLLFVLDPAEAQALLPPGFRTADVTDLTQFVNPDLRSPLPANRAVGGYDLLSCATDSLSGMTATFSQVGILVQPPNLGDRTPTDNATFDLYLIALHVGQPAWQEFLLKSGFTAETAPIVTVESEAADLLLDNHQGSGSVAIGEPLAEAAYVLPSAGNPLDFRARYWHVGANGTFYMDFRLQETVRAGAIPTCSHAEGSVFAQVTGTTTCLDGERFVAAGLDTEIQGVAFWTPNVFPIA